MNKIGIICAMKSEMDILLNAIGEGRKVKMLGCTFYEGSINNHEVVLSLCGVGKVNSAIAATLLISEFQCSLIINSGIAGGVSPLKKRDSVIASSLLYYDVDVTPFGYEKGQVPGLPKEFMVNPDLLIFVKSIFNRLELPYKCTKIYSGDQFVVSFDQLNGIKAGDGFAIEMQGASIAQVCIRAGIDFIVLRYISDIIGEENQEEEYFKFENDMAERSASVTLTLLKNME
jgi:adenosylhomocysteine nucleosidase